jgi:cytochrome c oxidase cbb3-type subunit III
MRKKILFSTLMLLLLSGSASALSIADTSSTASLSVEEMLIIVIVMIIAVIVVLFIIMAFSFIQFIQLLNAEGQDQAALARQEDGFWKWFWDKFNAAAPIEEEEAIILDHNYDGIRELDNQLPPWWKYGFYFTIALGVWYIYYYHISESEIVSVKEYNTQMAIAAVQKEEYLKKMALLIDENNVEVLPAGDAGIAAGLKIYADNCKSCHGEGGSGMNAGNPTLGPNLADEYWLHGGSINDIFKTIKYGVVEKGMISWQDQLSPADIKNVSNYILSLQGTNPQPAKEAQGELYKP